MPTGQIPTQPRHNRLFAEIRIGDHARSTRICSEAELYLFAHASRNLNPMNIPDREARQDADGNPETGASASALWIGALIAQLIGSQLPGPGTRLRAQSLSFHERVFAGDQITTQVEVIDRREPSLIVLSASLRRDDGVLVADGQVEAFAPTQRLVLDDAPLPEVIVKRHPLFDALLEACKGMQATRAAVVCPEDSVSLEGALSAWREGLIEPILIGQPDLIAAAAHSLTADISMLSVVAADNPAAAAARAVEMARDGQAGAIMKGRLHTDVLLRAVLARDGGLRTDRRLSHVFVFDVPTVDHLLFVTDAAINIAPDLATKADIIRNAIDLAHACGRARPQVGVLSAVETVNPAIPSTIDAAVLSKMAERGQITGGDVDGPLAMDNAVDLEAARTKGIVSLVAGRAEVLVAPNLEAGNMLAKELSFIAQAEAAGLALGARVPIILTSRADNVRGRLVSCALARLYDHWRQTGQSRLGAPDS